MLNFNRIKKTHAFSEQEEQGLPAFPVVNIGALPGIQRGMTSQQQQRPHTTQPASRQQPTLSSFAPNASYADYEWTYNEAMTYDPVRFPSPQAGQDAHFLSSCRTIQRAPWTDADPAPWTQP